MFGFKDKTNPQGRSRRPRTRLEKEPTLSLSGSVCAQVMSISWGEGVLGRSTEQTECQAFSPVVRIGAPHPLNPRRVCVPPLPPHPQAGVSPPFGSGGGGGYVWKSITVYSMCDSSVGFLRSDNRPIKSSPPPQLIIGNIKTTYLCSSPILCLCAVVEAPAKPAQRQEVRIADQIAIRSYVLAKNIGKIGEEIFCTCKYTQKIPCRGFSLFKIQRFSRIFDIEHSLHHSFNYSKTKLSSPLNRLNTFFSKTLEVQQI